MSWPHPAALRAKRLPRCVANGRLPQILYEPDDEANDPEDHEPRYRR